MREPKTDGVSGALFGLTISVIIVVSLHSIRGEEKNDEKHISGKNEKVGFLNNGSQEKANQVVRERFLREAPIAWAQLEELAKTMRGSYSMRDEFVKFPPGLKKKPVRTDQYEFAVNGVFAREESYSSRSSIKTTKVQNDQYVFGVAKEKEASQFSLGMLERIGSDPETDEKIKQERVSALITPCAAWRLFGKSFGEWLDRPKFVIKDVTLVKRDEEELVRVDFEFVPDVPSEEWLSIEDAYAIFDPNNHWVLREYNYEKLKENTLKHRGTLTYATGDQRLPPLQTNITFIESGDGQAILKRTVTFESLECEVVPEEEFYLSHYGLPEPNFDQPFLSTWMKYLLAGLACLGIAYWIKRRRVAA